MNNDDMPSPVPGGQQPVQRTDADADADTATMTQSERDTMRKHGLMKKLQFMTHLMRSLDLVVFAEMCAMYYMECVLPSSPSPRAPPSSPTPNDGPANCSP